MNQIPPTSANGSDEHHDQRLADALEVEVEQQEDDRERRRNDELHLRLGALHVLVLPAPDDAVAGRQLDHVAHHLLRVAHVAADVAARDVDVHPRRRHGALGAHDHRSRHLLDRRELAERDLRQMPHAEPPPPPMAPPLMLAAQRSPALAPS